MSVKPEFVIEAGIPTPEQGCSKYPFSQMSVGDSFLVPEGVSFVAVRGAAITWGKKNEKKFSSRKALSRIWRTA